MVNLIGRLKEQWIRVWCDQLCVEGMHGTHSACGKQIGTSQTYFAIGMLTNYVTYPNHLYRDGESVDTFFFDNGLPYILGSLEYGNDTCVGMNGEDFHHIPCSGYSTFEEMIISASTIEHGGEECFTYCNEQYGHCSWCGTEGFCCLKSYIGDGCDGLFGGEDRGVCVLKPGNVYFLKSS